MHDYFSSRQKESCDGVNLIFTYMEIHSGSFLALARVRPGRNVRVAQPPVKLSEGDRKGRGRRCASGAPGDVACVGFS